MDRDVCDALIEDEGMLFQTFEFLVFFGLLVLVLALIKANTNRKRVLLLASYLFYMWWNPAFVVLILYSTAIDYWIGKRLSLEQEAGNRRKWLFISLSANLLVLGFFKYGNFFQENFMAAQRFFGSEPGWVGINIILPVGISFYTLQSLSYTIDVYRGRIKASKSPVDFALFVAFFPQLVAGPIVRARDFLPQLERKFRFCFDSRAFFLVLNGLVKKVIIADNLDLFVEQVYTHPERYSGVQIWLAAMAFAVQLYCDFSGYSDMAIGVGRMLGYRLPENFRHPYLATNPIDYWRRWHISLSEWFRDYVYISLGGNRRGKFREGFNLFATTTLSGIWHGGGWNYVLWGVYHGAVLVGHRLVKWGFPQLWPGKSSGGKILSWWFTQLLVLFSYLIFRAVGWNEFKTMARGFFAPSLGSGFDHITMFTIGILVFFSLLHLASWRSGGLHWRWAKAPLYSKILVTLLVGALLVVGWPMERTPFIYFQF